MNCQGDAGRCENKAQLMVRAWGQHGWRGRYCDRHAARIIKLRGRMIRKYKQSVVVRPLTKLDKKKVKR